MSDVPDDPTVLSIRLLWQAGLRDFTDILGEQPAALERRLAAACRSLDPAPGPPGEEWVEQLITLARRRGPGAITATALAGMDLETLPGPVEWQAPDVAVFGASIGLAGQEDFDPWGRSDDKDKTIAESGLPGKEDFDPWRRKGDEDL